MGECRVGFVGAGGVALRHVRTLSSRTDATVIGVTDPDHARAAALAGEVGAEAVDDLATLLGLGVDAVYVCVPPFAHGAIEETVARAGVALFVEKPLGLDVAAAERVAAVVADTGIVTGVGHHWRSSALVARTRTLLAGRPVRLASARWLDKVPPVSWWPRRSGSGGQLVEQAVHVLDLARVLVGEVAEVVAWGDGRPPAIPGPGTADVDGATAGVLRFRDGAVGTVATTCALGWKQGAGLDLHADGVSLAVTEDALTGRDADDLVAARVDPDEAKAAADRAFVDAVLGRAPAPGAHGVVVDYAEALRTHRLACALAASAERGTPVTVDA